MKNQILASVHMDFVIEDGVQKLQIRAHRFNDKVPLKFDNPEVMQIKWALQNIATPKILPFQREHSKDVEKEYVVDEPPCA